MDTTALDWQSSVTAPNYEAVLDDFFSSTEKRLNSGGTREIGFSCSVSRDQGRFLHRMVKELKPQESLEIGLAWGGSAVHINCAVLENGLGRHTAIDPFQSSVWSDIARSELRRLDIDGCFEFHEERSDLVLPGFMREGRRFQFIFIDGDHRFDGVFVDFHFCQQLLDIGGLLIFDDATSEPIGRVMAFIRSNMPNLQFRGVEEGRFGVFYKDDEDRRGAGDTAAF